MSCRCELARNMVRKRTTYIQNSAEHVRLLSTKKPARACARAGRNNLAIKLSLDYGPRTGFEVPHHEVQRP